MLGGGYSYDETVAGVGSRLQPQQGYHPRGSWPSTPGSPPVAVGDATANPSMWTALVQAGGQSLASGKHMTTRAFALCATQAVATAAPVVQTGDPSATGASSTTLAGTITPGGLSTSYVFEYGTSLAFGAITTPDGAGAGQSPVAVSAPLSGLIAGRTYFYRLVATNSLGTTSGTVHGVTTIGSSVPDVQTSVATQVGATSATLTGLLNPNGQPTAFTFEVLGPGGSRLTAIDNAGAEGAVEPVALPLTGLAPATTYLYRLVATNASGTSTGQIASFTTSPGAA
jgi:phosphodiesterase/alkaline phosphatase D-like protein